MPKFKYVAVGPDGSQISGVDEASSFTALGSALRERGLHIKEATEKKSFLSFELTKKKVSRRDLMHFSRQMAVFLRAGIPVIDALQVIAEEVPPKTLFATVLADMMEGLQSGTTFTDSARTHPEAFPPFYLGVLEAAEMTGNLGTALDEVADYIERDLEARKKIKSALFYPGIVLLMSIATVVILTVFVLPRFKTFFEDMDASLPLPTRLLLGITGFMTTFWPLLLLLLIAIGLGLLLAGRSSTGRQLRDKTILRIPGVGDMIQGAIVERFCRTLISMVRAGVPLPDALAVTADGTNNAVYRQGLTEVRAKMLNGEGLAGPIRESGLFPGAARQMIRVGEETGTLHEQLETSAKYFGSELDYKITRFTNMFEPAVIMFMGVVVGFVAIALVSAMYGMFNQANIG